MIGHYTVLDKHQQTLELALCYLAGNFGQSF